MVQVQSHSTTAFLHSAQYVSLEICFFWGYLYTGGQGDFWTPLYVTPTWRCSSSNVVGCWGIWQQATTAKITCNMPQYCRTGNFRMQEIFTNFAIFCGFAKISCMLILTLHWRWNTFFPQQLRKSVQQIIAQNTSTVYGRLKSSAYYVFVLMMQCIGFMILPQKAEDFSLR